ncbi:MAG TPA: cytochrome-c oxidase, cbb3-type subunit III [Polaromonas sp.]|uniref:cytochrome-c oxidase, cbb3-type subunit III n=1 Tax=Polaromonas sp. TaxID=1869339 RepID=UPI002D262D2F|nr:cytochrome-c oxidase, cbb3-type subunit III [Polaromonas sp.]HYW58047.1 cytochrome-c oxidase, cbb3-type subunit III [Polaromonas sp.]
MSDFTNGFWSWYVAAISLVSILACGWLLWVAGKARVTVQPGKVDDNTTGHVWDEDLREYNNPLPLWWMWLFVLTIVFSLAYLVIFPGLGSFSGWLKWSTQGEHKQDVTSMRADVAPLYAGFAAQPAEALAKDPRALAIGERLFMNNCSQCHGSDGRGSKSYPNLTNGNSAWLGERGAAHIVQTMTQGRTGVMPAMGAAIGGDAEISQLAHYVLSLSASPHNEIKAFSGKKLYSACAACHGVDGKGNKAMGAPNLTDDYWLHGWGEAAIANIVKNGKSNVMPAQSANLTPEQIHVVSAYVLSLSRSGFADTTKAVATAPPAKAP